MKISVQENHFSSAAQAFAEIKSAGLHAVEMTVPPVKNTSHWHHFSTWIYILDGELHITDTARKVTLTAPPGSRVEVPERVLHNEESDGYTIIAGMSEHPASIGNPVDRDPAEL